MEGKPYLLFSWHGLRYGIEVSLVQEMFFLPELLSIVEAPKDIVGILNLRSRIVPIMHLDLRLGLQMQACTVNDGVVVLTWEGLHFGMITNEIEAVEAIAPEAIFSAVEFGRVGEVNPAFLSGIAKVGEDTVLLLNPEALLRHPETVEALIADVANGEPASDPSPSFVKSSQPERSPWDFYQRCCPSATPKEREIFRTRAEELQQTTADGNTATERIPLAAIALGNEYYGVDLSLVREFIDVRKVTPVPCCPNHITGNINLRGEVVTLVDIRQVLNLPLAKAGISKAVVIEVDDLVAGLPVDDVFDVEYFRSADVKTIPTTVAAGEEAFLQGTVPYQGKLLTILNLSEILSQGGLEVNETV